MLVCVLLEFLLEGGVCRYVAFFMAEFSVKKLGELRRAIEWSDKRLKPFKQHRLEAMRQFVGKNYSDIGGPSAKVPVNLIWLATTIYLRQLVPSDPKTLVLTTYPGLKPGALELEIALNHLLSEIQFADSIRTVVQEALFSMGVMKVGLEVRDVQNDLGWDHDAGQPFADAVLLDDWVCDMSATDYRQVGFSGNRYRMPYEFAMERAGFSKKALERLKPTSLSEFSGEGGSGNYRSSSLSQGNAVYTDEYGKFVELVDLWLPRENLYMTIQDVRAEGPPLDVREWEGPEGGPYHLLRFQPVPGNIMSLGPVQQWVDLASGVNSIWRKLGRQAERQKEFYTVQGPSISDGETVKNVPDGNMISVQGKVETQRTGGIDQSNLAFAIHMQRALGYLMGNIDAIGGLSAQSSTYGQDQMLSQASGRMIDDMRQTLGAFQKRVFRDIGNYMWEDPYIEIPLVKRPVEGVEIPFNWTPESREGDFSQYNIQIEPYSQRATTPEERLRKLMEFITTVALPAGFQLDPKKLARYVSKYTNLVELEDIMDLPPSSNPVETPGGSKAQNTTRTYETISRPGPSAKPAEDQLLAQNLFAGMGKELQE
mgnify:CR=1 FL=1